MLVKITKCSRPGCWYEHMIGVPFTVYNAPANNESLLVKRSGYSIARSDVAVIV